MSNVYMHLTNYALNVRNDNYEQAHDENGDEGHKRSLGAILQILKKEGCDTDKLMDQIKDLIVKTIIIGQPNLHHLYRILQPECLDNSMAFQILGFDVLIDADYKPYLLEVNCSPSFGTDSPLDYRIKKSVIMDAFALLNFSKKKRKEIIKQKKEKNEFRMRTGKTIKLSAEEREKLKQEKLAERFQHEASNMAGYELIYPSGD
jgi:hypothetical protein